jgi:hypothetical protein
MTPTVERCPWCGSTITHAKFLKVQAAIREDERQKLAEAEKAVRARLEKEVAIQQQKLLKERQAIDLERARIAKQIEQARLQADKQRKKDLAEARQIFQRELQAATLKKEAEFAREREALQKKVADMSRRVKKGGDIGEGAELDILSTPVFPAGKRELFVEGGVIVVAPARVRPIVEVLRKALISMHVAKLSDTERSDKLHRLFKFITSPGFKKKLAEASDLTAEALEIDVQEKRAHDNVWKKRGTVLSRIKHVLRDIDTDVSAIIESKDEPDDPPPNVLRPAAFRVTK